MISFSTDELIQEAIRNKFKECTVLTVAHRLRTVIDSDRILVKFFCLFRIMDLFCFVLKVLGNGEVLEFDSPSALLSNGNSYFVSLVDQTGPAEAEYLRTLANRIDLKVKTKKQERIVDDELISSVNENDPLLNNNV